MRLYGEVTVRPETIPFDKQIDLASVEIGGLALLWSNKHYGHPRNLIAPGRGNCMGDGWETARQPMRPPVYEVGADGLIVLPGCDWSILKLGKAIRIVVISVVILEIIVYTMYRCFTLWVIGLPGVVSNIEVDTNFYKGNYPESCTVSNLSTRAFVSLFSFREKLLCCLFVFTTNRSKLVMPPMHQ